MTGISAACVAAVGVSAKVCIARRLTLEAKSLLARTTLAVQTIAYELGFGEATNFGKFFLRETGMTPLGFRQSETRSVA